LPFKSQQRDEWFGFETELEGGSISCMLDPIGIVSVVSGAVTVP